MDLLHVPTNAGPFLLGPSLLLPSQAQTGFGHLCLLLQSLLTCCSSPHMGQGGEPLTHRI